MPVFRSAVQAEVLAALLLHPAVELPLTDLATRIGAPLSTVHAEVSRLVTAGILSERSLGRSRLLRADTANPAVAPLTQLLLLTYGPKTVVAGEFAGVDGVEQVILYGSWAARYLGTPGPPPRDVDVLVVGTAERADVYDAADRAEARIGLPVHPVLVSAAAFESGKSPLLREVKSAPYVVLTAPGRAA
jgi:predicted nucleotidyltransferase